MKLHMRLQLRGQNKLFAFFISIYYNINKHFNLIMEHVKWLRILECALEIFGSKKA